MFLVEQQILVDSLGSYATKALEEGASLCISQCGYEVTIEHFLYQALEYPASDLVFILRHFGVDKDQLRSKMAHAFERQRTGSQNMPVFSPLLLELLQDAWTAGSLIYKTSDIRTGVILYVALKHRSRYLRHEYIDRLLPINTETLLNDFSEICCMSGEQVSIQDSNTEQPTMQTGSDPVTGDSPLDKFGVDFTEMARNGNLDPVFCREKELDLVIDILLRRRKNNPIAVGDAGVGKSAIVEGLALRIVEGNVPEALVDVALWGLDLGALQAGASMKGEFEKRLKSVIDFVKNSSTPIILFIDEAHTLIGAGAQAGGGDAANLLKPALARGELRTIAATTWSEYKKYFEKDPALSRRFQLVKLDEPTIQQSQIILRGLLPYYEKNHNVFITESAIEAASRLSARYITGRQLPDKAIDVLDTACARVSCSLTAPPRALSHHQQNMLQMQAELSMIKRERAYGDPSVNDAYVDALHLSIEKVNAEVAQLEKQWNIEKHAIDAYLEKRQQLMAESEDGALHDESVISPLKLLRSKVEQVQKDNVGLLHFEVTAKTIADVIADWTGIPVSSMSDDELSRITGLSSSISALIKGQDAAITKIHQRLLTAKADLRREGLPLGSFLLVGPSGVGKSETAIQIAKLLFGSDKQITTVNMSEYQEKHSMSRLIGSPPGYVGYGEGGVLTEAIRQKPYSVVLLDEVEKADPDVLNLFYQAFDKGEINDGEGRLIDCKNIVFILTSNLGTDEIMAQLDADKTENMEELLFPILSRWFKPALLARMEVIPYLPLEQTVLSEIIQAKLDTLASRLDKKYSICLHYTDQVCEHISSRCNRSHNGARIIDSVLEGELLPPLSLKLLESIAAKKELEKITVDVIDASFSYTYVSKESTQQIIGVE